MSVTPITFFSEGFKLAGDLYAPDDLRPVERRAGIVLCHGYTGVKDLYLPDNARVLVEAGYVVLAFDYKGWGESEGPRTRLAPYSRVADVRAALTFLGAQAMVDENRLGIYGTSYGGATVVWTGAVEHLAPSPSLRLSRHFDLFTTDTGGSASAAVCRRTHACTYALHRAFYALKRDAGEPSARDAG